MSSSTTARRATRSRSTRGRIYSPARAEEITIAIDQERPRECKAGSKFLKLPVLYNYIGSLFFEGHLG